MTLNFWLLLVPAGSQSKVCNPTPFAQELLGTSKQRWSAQLTIVYIPSAIFPGGVPAIGLECVLALAHTISRNDSANRIVAFFFMMSLRKRRGRLISSIRTANNIVHRLCRFHDLSEQRSQPQRDTQSQEQIGVVSCLGRLPSQIKTIAETTRNEEVFLISSHSDEGNPYST